MRHDLHSLLHQDDYRLFRGQVAEWAAKAYKASLDTGELTRMDEFKDHGMLAWDFLSQEFGGTKLAKTAMQQKSREAVAAKAIGAMFEQMHKPNLSKTGVNTALGFNFYDLRGPVSFLYPVNTPFRNGMARHGRVNAGVGTAAHWMATKNPGVIYGGVSEGNRNAFASPDNNQYMAAYKEIGGERDVTFTAEFAGEGFTDNLADEHIRGLHTLFLQEEGMLLNGNSGTSGVGFKLGTPAAPTNTRSSATSGGFGSTTYVSACVVYLTGMGNPNNTQYGYGVFPTTTAGLTPNYKRTNADGSVDIIAGGMSAVSAMSAVVTCDSTHQTTVLTVPSGTKGVYGYAWFVNTTDQTNPSLANAYLAAITQNPTYTVTAAATGTQTAAATGLSTDNSYQMLDFDGLLTYAASNGYWKDMNGSSLTSQKNGRCTEVETALQYLFDNYQAPVDAIWGSSDAVESLDAAVRYSGTNASGFQFIATRNEQGNLLGGFLVSAYQSRFAVANPMGANAIPIRIHPMIPKGTLFFDISTNPYPHSRIPFVRGLLEQRGYYSIEWPITTRQWTFGTYVHEVLQHYVPWICAVITGIGTFNFSQ